MSTPSPYLAPPSSVPATDREPDVALYLHRARLMQRAARSERASESLPIVRRLVATDAFAHGVGVVELHRRRAEVRRRHCLLALAREAGMADWTALREALERDPSSVTLDARVLPAPGSYPNHWFSSLDEARAWQRVHGGRVLRHGTQAVVLPEHDPVSPGDPQ